MRRLWRAIYVHRVGECRLLTRKHFDKATLHYGLRSSQAEVSNFESDYTIDALAQIAFPRATPLRVTGSPRAGLGRRMDCCRRARQAEAALLRKIGGFAAQSANTGESRATPPSLVVACSRAIRRERGGRGKESAALVAHALVRRERGRRQAACAP